MINTVIHEFGNWKNPLYIKAYIQNYMRNNIHFTTKKINHFGRMLILKYSAELTLKKINTNWLTVQQYKIYKEYGHNLKHAKQSFRSSFNNIVQNTKGTNLREYSYRKSYDREKWKTLYFTKKAQVELEKWHLNINLYKFGKNILS
jgi:hypothetical protein